MFVCGPGGWEGGNGEIQFLKYIQNAGLFTGNIEWEKNNSFFSV